ncbi:MAG: DUF2341 domain-containing protein, partial [Terracidiphilus sp.]
MQTNGSTYATIGTSASLANLIQGNASFSFWVSVPPSYIGPGGNIDPGEGGVIMSKDASDSSSGWAIGADYENILFFFGGNEFGGYWPTNSGTWSYVTVTLSGHSQAGTASQTGEAAIYINGSLSAANPNATWTPGDDSAQPAYLANANTAFGLGQLDGSLDEIRISNVVRTADWIAAEYNNQSTPSAFYSVLAENTPIYPASDILYNSQNTQFIAPQMSICSTSITWSVSPSGLGTITASGLYTAPASITTQQTVTITATSQDNSAQPVSASVTLMPPVAVSMTPTSATLTNDQTQRFSASVANTDNTAVTWTIPSGEGGTIDQTGLYTAPHWFDVSDQIVTIIATSQADRTKSAMATVLLTPSLNITPASATLYGGQGVGFYASIGNMGNTVVNWSISPASIGVIETSLKEALYIAPVNITTQQTVTITATSQSIPALSGSATITLMPSEIVTPTSATLYSGQTKQLSATVGGTIDPTAIWSISPAGTGTISGTGLYTAPATITSQETVTITATNQMNTTQSASAVLTLSPSQCASSEYNYQRAIVIDHTKVPNTDQANFPFLFNTTDSAFATIANGGHVASASGDDIIFSTDPNGLTKLDHELEEYNPATGQVIAWVRIPTLSHTSDTVLYVFYGNSSITASQQNPTGVWDSNYMGVWHVANNGGQLSLADSTSNGNNATNNGATATAGQIDGGMQTDGTTYATIGTPASLTNLAQGDATFSAWVNAASDTSGAIMGKGSSCSGWVLEQEGNYLGFTVSPCSASLGVVSGPVSSGTWSYVAVTLSASANNSAATDGAEEILYINGVLSTTSIGGSGFIGDDSAEPAYLANGFWQYTPLNGLTDEFRISNIVRSADWIATEYSNQSSPSTFYALSPENTAVAVPTAVTLYASQSQQFTVPGQGACNAPATVSWSISPSDVGAISASGLYTAAATIASQQTVTVTATNPASGATISSSAVTLMPPVSISVIPASATLSGGMGRGQTQQFYASIADSNNANVTWTISPADAGSISESGLYTAPGPTPQQTVTVTATSQADSTKSASSTITLIPPLAISINPANVTINNPSQTQQFMSRVANVSNTAVTFSFNPPNRQAQGPGIGTLTEAGLYTAPANITSQQSVTIYAISQSDPTMQAAATITLIPPEIVTPTSATLYSGQSKQLSATAGGTIDPTATWVISPAGTGTISATGLYTAPATITSQQTVTITATNQANPIQSASAVVTLSPKQCASSGYGYQRAIVIDHTQIQNTDQVNFPFLFNTTHPAFATTANGGHVTSASGNDIIFSTDPNGATLLDYEMEEYNPVSGQVIAWVRIPTLSHIADTVLYVFYGNSSITASQQNPTGVWINNYQAVYHLANLGTGVAADSTVNGNNGTITSVSASSGEIDGAASFDGASSYIQVPSADFPSYPTTTESTNFNGSFGAWFKTASYGVILGQTASGGQPGIITYSEALPVLYIDSTGNLVAPLFPYSATSAYGTAIVSTAAYNDNKWHSVVETFSGLTGCVDSFNCEGTETLYVDGQNVGSQSQDYDNIDLGIVKNYASTYNYFFGTGETDYSGIDWPGTNDSWFYYGGVLDEVNISSIARSDDWIHTQYSNQSSPSTFYKLFPESTIEINPPVASLFASQSQKFTVSMAGMCSSVAANWSIPSGVPGELTTSGLYTAPSSIDTRQMVTVTATTLG